MSTAGDDTAATGGRSGLALTGSGYGALSLIVIVSAAALAMLLRANVAGAGSLGFSGLVVSDAESLTQTTKRFWSHPEGWPLDQLVTYLGVVIVYGPLSWFPRATTAVAINCGLLWAAGQTFVASLSRDLGAASARILGLTVMTLVLSNVYILEVIPYANKEIPLILLTNIFIHFAIYRSNVVLAVIPAIAAYIFRDGYGAILLIAALLLLVRDALGRLPSLLFLLVCLFGLLFVPSSDVASLDQSIARNVEIGVTVAGDKFDSWGLGISYLARLAGTLFNLGLRPQFFDASGGIYLLALGYWQLGILIVAGVAGAMVRVAAKGPSGAVSVLILFALLCISYSTFVQPRYMMPLAFYLCVCASRLGPWVWPVVALCSLAPFAFGSMGALPPLAAS